MTPPPAVVPGYTADLAREFRTRLLSDQRVVLMGHGGLLVLLGILLLDNLPGAGFWLWGFAVLLVTTTRGVWVKRAVAGAVPDARFVREARWMVLFQGLAWGVGTAMMLPVLPDDHAAIILIAFAGLTGAALSTLAADPPSFRRFLFAIYCPILVSLLLREATRSHLVMATLVMLFVWASLNLHGRAYRALVNHLETLAALSRSEAAQAKESAYLTGLLRSVPVAVAVLDDTKRVRSVNARFESLFGYSSDELTGVALDEVLIPPVQEEEHNLLVDRVNHGEIVDAEVPRLTKDGRVIAVRVIAAAVPDPTAPGIVVLYEDVTARRQAEEHARWKTALLEAQVHSSLDGILVVNEEGKSVLTNQRMADLWSLPPALAGDKGDKDESQRLDYVVTRTRNPAAFLERVQYLYSHPDESSRDEIELIDGTTLDRFSAPVIGHQGERYGRIWTFRDITESKRAEQAMREARDLAQQTAEARSMFLANMSHEIRTPMNAVLGMTELVLDTRLDPEQRHNLEVVRDSADGLLHIINDILDYSKIEADHLDIEVIPFQLERLLQATSNTFSLVAGKKGVELIVDVAPDVPPVLRGDPSRLRQVLTNLISNAIKFTDRGMVVVRVQLQSRTADQAIVRFAVRDSGIGIPAEKLGLIFQDFTQVDGSISRRYGGTGLGLAIAQRLVGLMGGRITVRSRVGRGSEFWFTLTLPLEREEQLPPANPGGALAGRRVLLVDDNEGNRRVAGEMLAAEGMLVTEVSARAAALDALQQSRVSGQEFALMVVDVGMPETDGFDLVASVRANPAPGGIPVLMLTSAGQRGDGARCRDLGINGYLTKPLSHSDLIESVTTLLGPTTSDGGALLTRHALVESRRSLRILLTEDVPVNQEVAATMLRRRGHQVVVANNGREAVAAVTHEQFDLVLMDIQMPEMDGFEATAAIRGLPQGERIPIVALTAHAMGGERERCLAGGMNGYLTKPFKAHQLYAAVEGWSGEVTPPILAATPGPGGTSQSVVCLDGLRAQLREAGAEPALDGIVATYLDSVPERMKILREALISGTAAEVATAAHGLKSPAGAIGAAPLAALLGQIEAAGRGDCLTERPALAVRVQEGSDAVLAELQEYHATHV